MTNLRVNDEYAERIFTARGPQYIFTEILKQRQYRESDSGGEIVRFIVFSLIISLSTMTNILVRVDDNL